MRKKSNFSPHLCIRSVKSRRKNSGAEPQPGTLFNIQLVIRSAARGLQFVPVGALCDTPKRRATCRNVNAQGTTLRVSGVL